MFVGWEGKACGLRMERSGRLPTEGRVLHHYSRAAKQGGRTARFRLKTSEEASRIASAEWSAFGDCNLATESASRC
jgi:hypothetical protein